MVSPASVILRKITPEHDNTGGSLPPKCSLTSVNPALKTPGAPPILLWRCTNMIDVQFAVSKPVNNLKGFENFNAFLKYSQTLFELNPQEHQGLYNILLKLQSVGEDPQQAMLSLKHLTDKDGSTDLIRFMIQVDIMDIEEIKKAA
jgi:hypothetical protein